MSKSGGTVASSSNYDGGSSTPNLFGRSFHAASSSTATTTQKKGLNRWKRTKPKKFVGSASFNKDGSDDEMNEISGSDDEAEEVSVVCGWRRCGKVFTNYEDILHHHESDHWGRTGTGDVLCKWTGCSTFGRANRHLSSHCPFKPFKCDYPGCTIAVKTAHILYKHQITHDADHIAELAIKKESSNSKVVVAKRNNNKSIEEKEATTGLGTRISLTLPSLLFEGFTTQSDFMLQDVNLKKDKEQEDAFDSVPSGRTKLE